MLENDNAKILWKFAVQTNRKLEYNKPEFLIVKKQKEECHIIDEASPFDTRVKDEEQ